MGIFFSFRFFFLHASVYSIVWLNWVSHILLRIHIDNIFHVCIHNHFLSVRATETQGESLKVFQFWLFFIFVAIKSIHRTCRRQPVWKARFSQHNTQMILWSFFSAQQHCYIWIRNLNKIKRIFLLFVCLFSFFFIFIWCGQFYSSVSSRIIFFERKQKSNEKYLIIDSIVWPFSMLVVDHRWPNEQKVHN